MKWSGPSDPKQKLAQIQALVDRYHIKVASAAELAKADYRACSVYRNMPGLTEDTCHNCGCIVYYETRFPLGQQKPTCLLCLVQIAKDAQA